MNLESLRLENAGRFQGRISAYRHEESLIAALKKVVSAVMQYLAKQRTASEINLRIDERISLGPKKSLFLICCDGRRFLVATGTDTVTSPIELRQDAAVPPAAGSRTKKSIGRKAGRETGE